MDNRPPTPIDLAPKPAPARDKAIDEAVARVEGLSDEPIAEHVEAFEHAHRILQEYLNEAVDG